MVVGVLFVNILRECFFKLLRGGFRPNYGDIVGMIQLNYTEFGCLVLLVFFVGRGGVFLGFDTELVLSVDANYG